MKKLNQKGQSLVEYLIIVALIAVSTLGVIRVVGQNVAAQYAKISIALGGNSENTPTLDSVSDNMYRKKDLHNFFQGSNNHSEKK